MTSWQKHMNKLRTQAAKQFQITLDKESELIDNAITNTFAVEIVEGRV